MRGAEYRMIFGPLGASLTGKFVAKRRATLAAVFGIFIFLDVPLVYASNRLWRTQHPQPVLFGGEGSGLDPLMAKVLLICVISLFGVMIPVLMHRYRLEILRHRVDELRVDVEMRDADLAQGIKEHA